MPVRGGIDQTLAWGDPCVRVMLVLAHVSSMKTSPRRVERRRHLGTPLGPLGGHIRAVPLGGRRDFF